MLNVTGGVRLWLYDSSTNTTTGVDLPRATDVELFTIVAGTVYFLGNSRDDVALPLQAWTPGQDPVNVRGIDGPTAVSADGQLVAGVTKLLQAGSCSEVVDLNSSSSLWKTCDYTVLGFSTDGSFAWAGPAYLDGYSIGDLTILDAQTGEVVRRLPAYDNGLNFLSAVFEDADHLLIRAEQRDQTALVRCTVSTGDCELATPAMDGTSVIGGSPYLLAGL